MSREVWLRPNQRIFGVGIFVLALALAGTIPLIAAPQHVAVTTVGYSIGAVILLLVFLAIRNIASNDTWTSLSVVAQLLTLIRMALFPCHLVPLAQQVPSS